MYKKERNRPFETREEVLAYHKREKIPCLECGKLLIFLPRHIWFVHGIHADEYHEKWNIPKHIALAGISYLEKRILFLLFTFHAAPLLAALIPPSRTVVRSRGCIVLPPRIKILTKN